MVKVLKNKQYKIEAKVKGKAGRMHLLANTGVPMILGGFPHPVVIDMEGVTFKKNATPIIADHDNTQRVGHSVEQSVVPHGSTGIVASKLRPGPFIYAIGVKSSKSEIASSIFEDAEAGFPFQVSVGADPELLEFFDKGEIAAVNGTSYQGPIIVSRKTSLYEYTVTVLGADSNTQLIIAASKLTGETSMTFEEWLKSLKLEASKLSAEATTQLKASHALAYPGTPTPVDPGTPTPAPPNVVVINAGGSNTDHITEVLRVNSIQAHFKHYSDVTEVMLDGTTKITASAFQEKALKENWTADSVELVFLRANRPQQNHQPESYLDPTRYESSAIECSILRSLGITASATNTQGVKYGTDHMFEPKVIEASHKPEYQSMCLHQLMDINIAASGSHYHGSRKSNDYIRAFMHAQRQIKASGFSTLAVSYILENVANKVLLSAYTAQETMWNRITARRSLSDFKAHSYYRLTTTGGYQKVNQQGELKHGEFSDTKYSLEADTYGMILALTRQTMINDDLNAFNQIPTQIGRLAALALEFAVFEMLLGNANNFFHADNKNLITGGTSALSIDSLTAAATKFRNQVDTNGKPILTSPSFMLASPPLEVIANQLYKDTDIRVYQAAAAAAKEFNNNPHVGKYNPLISPMLSNTDITNMLGKAITGQSSTQWYLFADPNVLPAFLVGFLNGVETPVLESSESDFDTLGMQWRSYHDWGVGQGESRGAVKSAGA